MAKKYEAYFQFVVLKDAMEVVRKQIAKCSATIVHEAPSTVEDIVDITHMHALAEYVVDKDLYITLIIKRYIDEMDIKFGIDRVLSSY